ncbi:MAG: DUF2723 domain-containing protein [Prevotella sp.]|nr:DUF2723 domain-containing protein [Prevotella sp.]
MKQFRLVDNIMGWLTFFIAAFVYCSTIEPTASFWDCPEFITTGYKLEVGHPPGAPFFMLTANLFSQFVSDPSQVARMVNMMSALLSAACILFLFWSITHLVRRLLISAEEKANCENNGAAIPLSKLIAIEASGLVGALIYTFSDTFWFSAVEGEVYAYSSAFTAVVFWLILKWEEHADEPHSDRWLVLIMYMTGLSIGVHLLNLLCLPAIVLVWYFKRFPNANAKGAIMALLISFVILAAVLYGVVPGIITVGGWFELFFVNGLGMPFNTGLIVYLVLLIGSVIWAIYETQNATEKNWKRQNIAFLLGFGLLGVPFYGYGWKAFFIGAVVLAIVGFVLFRRNGKVALVSARLKNTTLLCMLMLMIGYSTYAVIVIRSAANPPMDQNSPEDIFTLGSYLSRDQYGYRPLLWGQGFDSELAEDEETGDYAFVSDGPTYHKVEKRSPDEPDSYYVVKSEINGRLRDVKGKYLYAQNMFFPRMYSSAHASFYKTWNNSFSGRTVKSEYPNRYPYRQEVTMPTMWDNLSFFITYQCGYMYWRYFLWNFAGRQNDIQGLYGEREHGNALTGIPFIDNYFLGDQSLLSDDLKNNKGHNVFYCMPLILGLIGLFWQLLGRGRKGVQQFWVVFFLFFMTGLAIVVYLNQTPLQPRERDYAYAGSFYAYAIWCGIGVAAIYSLLAKKLKKQLVPLAALVGLVCLAVPIQMASQTWDDHDRSGRYTCRDFGQNYLMTLQQTDSLGRPCNPIIFTNGDNDTFPLWYNQDTEGVRTDARVCNLSYLQTDWYIDQMIRPAYDSPSLPITWKKYQYCDGTNDWAMIDPYAKYAIQAIQQASPDEAAKVFGEDPFELKNVLTQWVRDERPKELKELQRDYLNWAFTAMKVPEQYHMRDNMVFIPTDTVYITIDKDAVRRSGMMMQSDSIPDRMAISLSDLGGVDKSKLMMLELLANANWERPIYVAMTVGQDNYMNLGNHFVQEGLAYRITPFTTNIDGRPVPGMTSFDTEKTYDNVMNRFKFGGVSTKGIYLDETVMRMCLTHRMLMVDLATHLADEGQDEKALAVLEKMDKELPEYNVPYDIDSRVIDGRRLGYQDGKDVIYSSGSSYREALIYIDLGQEEKARPILDYYWKRANQLLTFYLSLGPNDRRVENTNCLKQLNVMMTVIRAYYSFDETKAQELNGQIQERCKEIIMKGGDLETVHWE